MCKMKGKNEANIQMNGVAILVLVSVVNIFAQSFHWGAVVFVQRPQNSFNSEATHLWHGNQAKDENYQCPNVHV